MARHCQFEWNIFRFLMHLTFVLLFFFSFSYLRHVLFHFESNQLRNFSSVCLNHIKNLTNFKSLCFFFRREKKCFKAIVMWSQLLTAVFFHVVIGFSKHRTNYNRFYFKVDHINPLQIKTKNFVHKQNFMFVRSFSPHICKEFYFFHKITR